MLPIRSTKKQNTKTILEAIPGFGSGGSDDDDQAVSMNVARCCSTVIITLNKTESISVIKREQLLAIQARFEQETN